MIIFYSGLGVARKDLQELAGEVRFMTTFDHLRGKGKDDGTKTSADEKWIVNLATQERTTNVNQNRS